MKRMNVVLMLLVLTCSAAVALAQQRTEVASGQVPREQPLKPIPPDTYGTDFVSYHRMGASEFTPLNVPGTDNYTDTFYFDAATYRRHGTVANGYFIGTPHLPSGAKVLTVFVEGCSAGAGTLFGTVSGCNYSGNGCTVLALYDGVAGCGFDTVDLSGENWVVDNRPGGNLLVIRLATNHTDGTDSFAGVSIAYQLQVSPAPQFPTFGDVPLIDPGFQYIEALAASGITGGCGSGLYCPDNPVTRRQMAIFISKALGLHFP